LGDRVQLPGLGLQLGLQAIQFDLSLLREDGATQWGGKGQAEAGHGHLEGEGKASRGSASIL